MKKIFMIFAAFAAIAMVSCNKDKGGDEAVDPTGGIDVAKENLVVYLSFDDDAVQLGKDVTFEGRYSNAVLEKGVRGKAYKNTGASTAEKAYMAFNLGADNPFKSLTSFTITCWMKCPLPVSETPGTGGIFALNGGDDTMGSLCFFREGWAGDNLTMKVYLQATDVTWPGHDIALQNEAFLADTWYLFGYAYDENTSKMSVWANGVLVTDSERFAGPKPDPTPEDPDPIQPNLGPLKLKGDMTKLYIGAWKKAVEAEAYDDWMGFYPGMLDELRVFNKALSEQEMLALYQAEVKAMD